MELANVKPSEITFEKKLSSSRFSVIFLVTIRSRRCIMKVHHGRGPRKYYEPKDRELDIHVLESTAYRRLKQHGLCDRGLVPQFYGTIEKIDPWCYQPDLKDFLEDIYPPSAILLEYIPDLEMIQLQNYTNKRMDNLIEGLKELHKALIRHGDPKPRNMMVVKNDPERVIWIDFDRAETYDQDQMTQKQKALIKEEEEIVISFKDCLEADYAKGKLEEAYIFYCT